MDMWTRIGEIEPRELTGARHEIHHALQLVSIAVGRSLLEAREDDSHTALSWLDVPAQWVGGEIPDTELRAGLRPADLALTLGGKDDPAGLQLELVGQTRQQALQWLRDRLAEHGIDRQRVELDIHYDLPSHAVADGAAWSGDLGDGRAELTRYFAAASALLLDVTRGTDATPILTWPHHFDMATLLDLGDDRTVGVGLSAGDGTYDEPYFYISPYPRPEAGVALPALPAGHWHTDGFFAAVLTATELLEADDPGESVRETVTSAIAAARGLLA